MLTGYNTDVRHRDLVLHVQTEDKGRENPCVESLVYYGGRVLAAKRASYAHMLADGSDERAVVAFMDRLHRTVVAAIRQGKFDEKLDQMLAGGDIEPPAAAEGAPPAPAPPPSPPRSSPTAAPSGPLDRTLDQVILEYLSNEAEQEHMVLAMEEYTDVALGQRAALALRAGSSKTGEAVDGARVEVRMISTTTPAQVLASGGTDPAGRVRLEFDIPPLGRGTAALIIRADGPLGQAELKQLL